MRECCFRWRPASAYASPLNMNPAFIVVLVVQVLLIVHCIRTGRNSLWIWVLAHALRELSSALMLQGRGNAVKKREDTHKMAEANRAFSHYRW